MRATMAGGGLYRDLVKQATGETIRSIGKALGIDPSCVPEWAKRKREMGSLEPALILGLSDQNWWAHWRSPMDMIFQG